MIQITIKTLDSRNHEFSVEDDLTVKQLKEQIAESVNVPAESQRLIYCGRVLLDDKKLTEYDVNGKVIHLVQRAPPSTSGGSSSTSGSTTTGRSSERSRGLDNAMYLGAMAFPADLMDAQGLTVPPARHTLSNSRLGVARSMLARAITVLQSLEGRTDAPSDPSPSSDSGTPVETPTPAEPAQDDNIQSEVTVPSESTSTSDSSRFRSSDIAAAVSAASEAVTAALDHALSVHHGGNVSITVNNTEGSGPEDLVVRVTQVPGNESNSTPSATTGTSRSRTGVPQRTSALAVLLSKLLEVQTRMSPYMNQVYNLMQNDPPDASDSQPVFNQVSELMHILAHAFHALSDIMCDLSQPPPRVLRCRPVLIQHSAVLQTGIPIQVPAAQILNFSTASGPSSNRMGNVSQNETQNNNPSQNNTNENSTSNTSENQPRPESQAQTTRRQLEETIIDQLRGGRGREGERDMPAVYFSPSNLEIHVGSGSITFDSLNEALLSTTSAPSSSSNNPQPSPSEQPTNNQSNSNSDGDNPSMDSLINNILQRMYGDFSNIHNNNYNTNNNNSRNNSTDRSNARPQTAGSSTTSDSTNSTSNTSSNSEDNANQRENTGGSSSANTTQSGPRATFTSRPHIHIGPGIGSVQGVDFFDPFLPCNSHHIRGRRRGVFSSSQNLANSTPESNQQESSESAPQSTETSNPGSSTSSHPTVQMTILPDGTRRSIVDHVFPVLPREIVRNLLSVSSEPGGIMRTTVAQFLESLSDRPYTPGESLIMDFFMIAGRSVMLQDILGGTCPAMLGWMRPGLRDYLENTLGVDSSCPDAAIQSAVERINNELTPFFQSSFQGLTMRDDVDLPASIRKISQTYLPQLIKDIHRADNFNYLINVSNHLLIFLHEIICVLAYASNTPRVNLDPVIFAFARKLVHGNSEEVRSWLVDELGVRLRGVIRPFDLARESYRKFIVKVTPPQENSTQPMEVDGIEESIVSDVISTSLTERENERDREPLPHVIIGSEPWHHRLPPDWVPIITRDRERQRRGANQGPLSDAYLAGMPSKRRKLITENKPNPSLNKVISESMGRALGASGLSSSATSELVEAAACDTGLRNAYKQQVRSSVETTLRSHPDYHPDKYPNTAKYFNRLR